MSSGPGEEADGEDEQAIDWEETSPRLAGVVLQGAGYDYDRY